MQQILGPGDPLVFDNTTVNTGGFTFTGSALTVFHHGTYLVVVHFNYESFPPGAFDIGLELNGSPIPGWSHLTCGFAAFCNINIHTIQTLNPGDTLQLSNESVAVFSGFITTAIPLADMTILRIQ